MKLPALQNLGGDRDLASPQTACLIPRQRATWTEHSEVDQPSGAIVCGRFGRWRVESAVDREGPSTTSVRVIVRGMDIDRSCQSGTD